MSTSKIVLVTGANKGIGRAAAGELGRAGHVVYLGARDAERGTRAAAELSADGSDVRFLRLDVTEQTTVAAAADEIDRAHGRLDVLVNNAGISRDRRYGVTDMPIEALREVYETNVLGVVAVTNAMLPLLRRAPDAVVGNVSSGLGTVAVLSGRDAELPAYGRLLAYNSSKAALNAVTMIYAMTLREEGIRVNALSPGFCATDLNNHAGVLSAEQGGRHVADQVLLDDGLTGVFRREEGGTYPW